MSRKYGPRKKQDLAARLWRRVAKGDGCWLWTGATFKATGYGQIRVNGTSVTAHRVAYQVANGPITVGLSVCHRCDVRLCCNPAHLFLGTAKDNAADMVQKGRYTPRVLPKGSAVHNSKLTESDVDQIRQALVNGMRNGGLLARQFGVSTSTIYAIKSGQNWRHVTC